MEWRRLLVVAVVAIAAAAAVPAEPQPENGHVSNICDRNSVCNCKQDVIACACTKNMQNLVVNTELVPTSNLQTMIKFDVRNCSSVSFLEHAFKTASKLELVHISSVKNVSFSPSVFENLQSLLITMVESLILQKGAFEGVHNLNNIVITKTHIPSLVEGVLYNIKDLQEFRLKEVNITKIEKDAVLIDLKHSGSKAEILQSKIGSIETRGLQIGNGSYITIQDTEIQNAEPNSIRLGALDTVELKGNKFHPGVHTEAAKILFKEKLEFTKNILLNVDLSNATNLKQMPENETIFTLERLVTLYGGNNVNCKCINPASNTSEPLKRNICIRGCNEATVAAFLQSCQKNNAISVDERLKALCKNTADKTTTTAKPQRPGEHTTVKPKNASGKSSAYVLLPVAFFLFHITL